MYLLPGTMENDHRQGYMYALAYLRQCSYAPGLEQKEAKFGTLGHNNGTYIWYRCDPLVVNIGSGSFGTFAPNLI